MDSRMITVESGFQYSVNLKYDVRHPSRVRTYIPTESFATLMGDIIESLRPYSTHRARIVIGPYGTGKSHLITVLAALLKKHLHESDYAPLLSKLYDVGYGDLVPEVESLLDAQPFLTVMLDPSDGNLQQIFVRGLKEALADARLEDLMPQTVFKTVEDTLSMWRQQYSATFDRFQRILYVDHKLTADRFAAMLRDYDEKAVRIFRRIFPSLSAGAEFDGYNTNDIPAMYREVSSVIQGKGYRGIYVFFDEFGKVLESAAYSKKSVDLKLLQDFAEMCNRSAGSQVHLMLVSHQHISQYASILPEEVLNSWQKVEGRFASVSLRQGAAKTYQLISAVIGKEPVLWKKHRTTHRSRFQRLLELTKEKNIFSELGEAELKKWVLQGCYPLHPATVFALPRVCNRLAQNERTLFTFLATKDPHSLGRFLEETDQKEFRLLTLDVLFDYFADSAVKKRAYDYLGNAFILAAEALSHLGSKPDLMAVKIIKSLAIMIGLEEPGFPPTVELLRFSLVDDSEDEMYFESALQNLVDSKLVYVRRSDGRIQFLTGSDVNFPEAIQAVRGNYRYANMFRTCDILNEFFAPYPVVANRYNDKFEMTRFFYQEFFSADDLLGEIDWDDYLMSKNYADGLVAYIVCETDEQHEALEGYLKAARHPRVVFLCSKEPLQGISELAYDYLALQILKKDNSFLQQDPFAEVELAAYTADYEQQIEIAISPLVDYRLAEQVVFYKGARLRAPRSHYDLSRLVSDICEISFSKTPKINNELINRTNVTRTVANARKKVVRALLSDVRKPQLGLTGYGPDVSIFRSLLRRPRIYREEGKRVEIVLDEQVEREFRTVIELIKEKLMDTKSQPMPFSRLLDELRQPPYGLRLGALPVFIAIAFRDLRKRLLIRDKDARETPLDAELLEVITKNPEQFTVETIGLDRVKKDYLERLSVLFKDFLPSETTSHNYAYPVGMAMKRWFVSLPRYTRESRRHSERARLLGRVLSLPMTDSTELLFLSIPASITGRAEFSIEEVETYIDGIETVKRELETHIVFVRAQLEEVAKQCFGVSGANHLLSTIISEWYAMLSDRTKSYAFSGTAFKLMSLAKSVKGEDNSSVLDKLVTMMVGLDLVDWSDDIRDRFEIELQETIQSITDVERDTLPEEHHKVTFAYDNGEVHERVYAKVEISSLGQVLYSELASALDGFADAITMDEKRQILLELLKGMS